MVKYTRDYKKEQQVWKGASYNLKKKVYNTTQNFSVVDGQAYDTNTGENITDRIHVEPIISKKQREGNQMKKELTEHEDELGGYVFAFFHTLQTLGERFPSLTQSEMARLMFIGTYVSFNEGDPSHGYLHHANGVPINKRTLMELLDMSRNKYGEFYRKLIAEGILSEMDEGLAVNPTVFYRGENLAAIKGDLQYTRLFRKTARELYQKFNDRSIKKLGVVYSILPYINFNFNIICDNPTQVKDDKLRAMTLKDLAERLDYKNPKNLSATMREIKCEGKPVFKFVNDNKDFRSSYIIVNPSVVYAGNGKHLGGIKILFN